MKINLPQKALPLYSAQEKHGTVGGGPEEGHENVHGAGEPLLCRQAERVGVQSGEEKALGRP